MLHSQMFSPPIGKKKKKKKKKTSRKQRNNTSENIKTPWVMAYVLCGWTLGCSAEGTTHCSEQDRGKHSYPDELVPHK
jgi:hypothetical protein